MRADTNNDGSEHGRSGDTVGNTGFWLNLPSAAGDDGLPLPEVVRLGAWADGAGVWDQLCVADTVLGLGTYDATVALAALAATTTTARLAVSCMATLGFRDPLIVAQQWANLDRLSGGRMTLIACTGSRTGEKHERELRAFGMRFDEKLERATDAVRFLRSVSRRGRIGYAGSTFSYEDQPLVPAFQQEALPIWFAANPSRIATPAAVARIVGRVAELGDGWLTYNVTPELLRQRLAVLAAERSARGLAPAPTAVQVNFAIADTTEAAWDQVRATWARQATRGVDIEWLASIAAVGTADAAAAFVRELVAAGADVVSLSPLGPDPVGQIELATRELLPLLRG